MFTILSKEKNKSALVSLKSMRRNSSGTTKKRGPMFTGALRLPSLPTWGSNGPLLKLDPT
jgi:hypothetical protein